MNYLVVANRLCKVVQLKDPASGSNNMFKKNNIW